MTSNPTSDLPPTIIIDVDGTLCPLKSADARYCDLVPFPQMLARLRQYRERGFRIALHTSRNMRTHGGNLGLINALTAPELVDWLRRWDVPFDELHLGKPWPGPGGFYIDDRTVRPDEFLALEYDELIDRMKRSQPESGAI